MKLRIGLAMLWLLCIALAVVSLIWMLVAIVAGSGRALLIALGFDRLGNATAGGDDGEYISSRCWRYRSEQPYRALRVLIDGAFALVGEADHCKGSYNRELLRAKARAAMDGNS